MKIEWNDVTRNEVGTHVSLLAFTKGEANNKGCIILTLFLVRISYVWNL